MLTGIAGPKQMRGRAAYRQGDEFSRPLHLGSDLFRPLEFAERRLLAHVVHAPGGARIASREDDCCGHVSNVAARRMPCGQRLGKQNVTAAIADSLYHRVEAMQWIARSI